MKLLLTSITLLLSFSAFADALPKTVLLSKIMEGSGKWESRPIFFILESHQKNFDAWSGKQKIAYPKFESDLLYYKYTYDEEFEYQFYFNYIQNQCLYEAVPREAVRSSRLCKNDIELCLGEKTPDSSNVQSCFNKSTNCLKQNRTPKVETIDKKYCEKLYNRSL